MRNTGGNNWLGTLPASTLDQFQVEWYLVAHDKAINPVIYPAGAPDSYNNIWVVETMNKPGCGCSLGGAGRRGLTNDLEEFFKIVRWSDLVDLVRQLS
jgi:hypothetical protein